jgi:leader peptidase (prepilin peptidase)/N-methyltransferase
VSRARVDRATALIAIAGGAVGAAAAVALGRSLPGTVVAGVAVGLLAAATRVDLRERRVPNTLTYGGAVAAVTAAAIEGPHAAVGALLGLALAGGVMAAAAFASRGALGLGDVKLAAAVGALLGPAGVPLFLVASGTAGALGAAWLLIRGGSRRDTMPYAPALAAGAVVALLLSGSLIR